MSFLWRSNTERTKGVWLCAVYDRQADKQISQKWRIFAGEMYSTICVKWVADHFGSGLVWRKLVHVPRCAQKRFLHFRSQWPWPMISKLVSRLYLHQIWSFYGSPTPSKRMHGTNGQTDRRTGGVQHLMQPIRKGRIIMVLVHFR